jgi:hypothetical protein
MEMAVFWDAAHCRLADIVRRFTGAYCLLEVSHLHIRRHENLKAHHECICNSDMEINKQTQNFGKKHLRKWSLTDRAAV